MSPATKKHQQLILLEPGKAALLDALSAGTGIPKQALLREAVDNLLYKHRAKIAAVGNSEPSKVVRFKTKSRLAMDRVFDEIARSVGLESFEQLNAQVKIDKEAIRTRKRLKTKNTP